MIQNLILTVKYQIYRMFFDNIVMFKEVILGSILKKKKLYMKICPKSFNF